MRAVGLDYDARRLTGRELDEPRIERDDHVLFRVREVGICGTDRELASFRLGFPPKRENFLVLGHEALGEVVETGQAVATLRPGDWVAPTIRRACDPPCPSCARGRRDLCVTGKYRERGIFGLHGYFCEYAVDSAGDLMRVPAEMADVAVLAEPLSCVEKAVETALRLHEPSPSRALVLGAGTIGILTGLALLSRGLSVSLYSLEPRDHPRVRLIEAADIRYLRSLSDEKADIVIEASGSPEAAFAAMRCLAPLGVCGILGVASDSGGTVPFRDLLAGNQTVFGSVNAGPQSFSQAIQDLARLDKDVLRRLIRRVRFSDFRETILGAPTEEPKLVHVI